MLDADEKKYPSTIGSASARTALASVQQSNEQSSMDDFISTSKASLGWFLYSLNVVLNNRTMMNTNIVSYILQLWWIERSKGGCRKPDDIYRCQGHQATSLDRNPTISTNVWSVGRYHSLVSYASTDIDRSGAPISGDVSAWHHHKHQIRLAV